MSKGRKAPKKQNLLIIADAGVDTGFANVTHNLIHNLHRTWNINVLAINYYGDPHPIQTEAQLWNPSGTMHGDLYGFSRIQTLAANTKADVVLVINDPWIAAEYVPQLKKITAKKVLYTPVDAKNIKSMFVNRINEGFNHVIAYTEFGSNELIRAGLQLPTSVIPHGIDRTLYFPIDKAEVRRKAEIRDDYFIVQVVDRNQPRKRLDLAFYAFAEWVKRTNKPDNVMIFYHGAVKDEGWDIGQLTQYLGIDKRLILTHQDLNPSHGLPIEAMKFVYNIADVKVSATMGEGWGFTTMESMACGIPNAVPNYSALGEWTAGGVHYIDIDPTPYFTPKGVNTYAGVPNVESMIHAFEKLYQDKDYREHIGKQGLAVVSQPKYEWKNIAKEFDKVFNSFVLPEMDDE